MTGEQPGLFADDGIASVGANDEVGLQFLLGIIDSYAHPNDTPVITDQVLDRWQYPKPLCRILSARHGDGFHHC